MLSALAGGLYLVFKSLIVRITSGFQVQSRPIWIFLCVTSGRRDLVAISIFLPPSHGGTKKSQSLYSS